MDQVKINGMVWDIEFHDHVAHGTRAFLGYCNFDMAKIDISLKVDGRALPLRAVVATVVHELIHAVEATGECGMSEQAVSILTSIFFEHLIMLEEDRCIGKEALEELKESLDIEFHVGRFHFFMDDFLISNKPYIEGLRYTCK